MYKVFFTPDRLRAAFLSAVAALVLLAVCMAAAAAAYYAPPLHAPYYPEEAHIMSRNTLVHSSIDDVLADMTIDVIYFAMGYVL